MIHAHEPIRVAGPFRAHYRTLVRTAILEHMDLAVGMASHDDRLSPYLRGAVVARLWYLAVMPHVDPGPAEDAIHLQFVYVGIDVHSAVNAFRLNQMAEIGVVPL